jgi:hypothetical protein
LLLVCFGLGGLTQAAEPEPSRAASQAATVAPLIDGQTIGVIYVDTSRVPIEPLKDQFIAWIPAAGPAQRMMRTTVDAMEALTNAMATVQQAGVKEMYFLVSLDDLPQEPPCLVLPLTAEVKPDAVERGLKSISGAVIKKIGSVLVAGGPKTVARLERVTADSRPSLQQAFEATDGAPVQVLVIPTAAHRKVVGQMMPRLPKELGGGPVGAVAQGLVWISLGVTPPPQSGLRLVIQADSDSAATTIRTALEQTVSSMAAQEIVEKSVPNFKPITEMLMPMVEGSRLVTTLDEQQGNLGQLFAALGPLVQRIQARGLREESSNHLKQFGLAMHNYHDTYKQFPSQASSSPDGKPLLSWRVLILPFVDGKLYKQFHLDEPWDSEHNRKLIDEMPAIYRSPAQGSRGEKGLTTYVVPVGEGAIFGGKKAASIKDIADGTCNTILVVEVPPENAVIWTKPDDLAFDPQRPAKGLGEVYPGGFPALTADGAAHFLPVELLAKPELLRTLFTESGMEVIDWDDVHGR